MQRKNLVRISHDTWIAMLGVFLLSSHTFADTTTSFEHKTGITWMVDYCDADPKALQKFTTEEKGIVMSIMESTICGDGPAKPQKPWPPRFSKSCDVGAGVGHLFSNDRELQFVTGESAEVIVGHGVDLSQSGDFWSIYGIDEVVPIFANSQIGTDGLSSKEVKSILEGKVTQWDEIGGSGGDIMLYLHGGDMQRKALSALLEKYKIQIGDDVERKFAPDYETLTKEAASDPNAIVIGAGGFEAPNLSLMKIDNLDARTEAAYPFSLQIYYGLRGSEAQSVFSDFVVKAYGQMY